MSPTTALLLITFGEWRNYLTMLIDYFSAFLPVPFSPIQSSTETKNYLFKNLLYHLQFPVLGNDFSLCFIVLEVDSLHD